MIAAVAIAKSGRTTSTSSRRRSSRRGLAASSNSIEHSTQDGLNGRPALKLAKLSDQGNFKYYHLDRNSAVRYH